MRIRCKSKGLWLAGWAALSTLCGASAPAEAADYLARGRISQFDDFTEKMGTKSATVLLDGDHGDPAHPYLVSAFVERDLADTEASVSADNIQLKTAHGQIDNLGVTFSSEINALASGGSITVKIPFTITYYVDVPEPPHPFSQGTASAQYTNTVRQQPTDFLVGNDSGILTLVNPGAGSHQFTNQSGAFASATPLEAADETISGQVVATLNDSPGNAIEVELFVLTTADAGGSGAGGFADTRMFYQWELTANDILDATDTPIANAGVAVAVAYPEVPSAGGLGLFALAFGVAVAGARASRVGAV